MATDYGGQAAYGDRRGRHGRAPAILAVAAAVLVAGAAGLGVSLVGVVTQVLPRQFTAHQQQQIIDWEVGKRWRLLTAGTIFAASVRYAPPAVLDGGGTLSLSARRIGIARQASCQAATDGAVAAVLTRNGCQAVLRATYVDTTDTYVVTVGVAVFGAEAEASAAQRELPGATPGAGGSAQAPAPGVLPVLFKGTPAAWFTSGRRQITASLSAGTYVIFYAVGYADQRPRLPVAADSYADGEMTSVGMGLAQAVASVLAAPVAAPRCPGTPGC